MTIGVEVPTAMMTGAEVPGVIVMGDSKKNGDLACTLPVRDK
jgi:hypothetical protein